MRFTLEDLKKSKVYDKNRHLFEKKKRKPRRPTKHVLWMKEELQKWCDKKGYVLLEEHRFHPHRKFRFDWAIKEIMVALEYEGINSKKSGHTTMTGYTKDATKYNLAQSEGWKVLRFTVLNYQTVVEQLEKNI